MFQRGSKFYSKISSGGSIFCKKLVPGGTNFGGSIFAVTQLVHAACSRLRFRCRRNHRLMCRTERNRTAYSGKYLLRALENLC